jgi:hypothetical protein
MDVCCNTNENCFLISLTSSSPSVFFFVLTHFSKKKKALLTSVGLNVTDELKGIRAVNQGLYITPHKHSVAAWLAIKRRVIGLYGPAMNGKENVSVADTLSTSNKNQYALSSQAAYSKRFSDNFETEKWIVAETSLVNSDLDRKVIRMLLRPSIERQLEQPTPGEFYRFRLFLNGVFVLRSYTPVAIRQTADGQDCYEFYIRVASKGVMSRALAKLEVRNLWIDG